MRESKQIIIGGQAYTLVPFTAIRGYKTLTKLLKVVGGPLGLVANAPMSDGLGKVDIGKVALTLTDKLDSDEGHQLVMEILSTVYINNRELKNEIETHFAGQIGNMIELVIETTKFQFEDVFQKLASVFQGPMLASLNTQFQSTSAGPSGESLSPKLPRLRK
jgi:hypothetical protein